MTVSSFRDACPLLGARLYAFASQRGAGAGLLTLIEAERRSARVDNGDEDVVDVLVSNALDEKNGLVNARPRRRHEASAGAFRKRVKAPDEV